MQEKSNEQKTQEFMVQVALHRAQYAILNAPEGVLHDGLIGKAVDHLIVELDRIGLKKPLKFIKDRLESEDADTLPSEKKKAMLDACENLYQLFTGLGNPEKAEESRAALNKKGFSL